MFLWRLWIKDVMLLFKSFWFNKTYSFKGAPEKLTYIYSKSERSKIKQDEWFNIEKEIPEAELSNYTVFIYIKTQSIQFIVGFYIQDIYLTFRVIQVFDYNML
jgi:hypothetical protein